MSEYILKDDIQDKISAFDSPIKSLRDLSEDEKNLIGDIRAGMKRKYKLFFWPMKGEIALQANNEKYSELINRYEVFRRRYLYKNIKKPTCAVLEEQNLSFSIHDLRKEPLERQKECINNIASAESREIFNPEVSAPLKIRVLIISEDRIVVLMKVYTYVNLPMSPFDIRRFIFFNLRIDMYSDLDVDENRTERSNQEIINKCFEYWRNRLKDVDKPVVIPLSNNNVEEEFEFYTIRKSLEPDLYNKILKYKDKTGYSLEQIFIYEYGHLFGEASGTRTPLFAVRAVDSYMQMMPCVVNLNASEKEAYENIKEQSEQFYKYDQCSFDEAMNAAGINISKYFNVMLEFLGNSFSDDKYANALQNINESSASAVSPKLEIMITYSDSDLSIRYSYDSVAVSENLIDMIQESLESAIKERISSKEKFSWKTYIEDYKNREEQLSKLAIAQKALHIKNADFLKTDEQEDLMKLATGGIYGNYVSEDVVLEAGQINSFGILISGHLEERQMDFEGKLKTISIYKTGYILGLESVSGISKCPFEYVAADDVKILWLNLNELQVIIQNNPSSYEALMKRAVLEAHRIKRLWTLD